MKLSIDRARWLHGEGSDYSFLLRGRDGKMCCLGFLCLAEGATADELLAVRTPAGMYGTMSSDIVARLVYSPGIDTSAASRLVLANDDEDYTHEQRESAITLLMKEIGVEVEFYGECTMVHEYDVREEE